MFPARAVDCLAGENHKQQSSCQWPLRAQAGATRSKSRKPWEAHWSTFRSTVAIESTPPSTQAGGGTTRSAHPAATERLLQQLGSSPGPWGYRERSLIDQIRGMMAQWHLSIQLQRAVPRTSPAKGRTSGAAVDTASFRK